ncbi:MAG: hypothetical protein QXT13_09630, partial [Pyrobaculum sp.]
MQSINFDRVYTVKDSRGRDITIYEKNGETYIIDNGRLVRITLIRCYRSGRSVSCLVGDRVDGKYYFDISFELRDAYSLDNIPLRDLLKFSVNAKETNETIYVQNNSLITPTGESVEVDGKKYEVYRDQHGFIYLRGPDGKLYAPWRFGKDQSGNNVYNFVVDGKVITFDGKNLNTREYSQNEDKNLGTVYLSYLYSLKVRDPSGRTFDLYMDALGTVYMKVGDEYVKVDAVINRSGNNVNIVVRDRSGAVTVYNVVDNPRPVSNSPYLVHADGVASPIDVGDGVYVYIIGDTVIDSHGNVVRGLSKDEIEAFRNKIQSIRGDLSKYQEALNQLKNSSMSRTLHNLFGVNPTESNGTLRFEKNGVTGVYDPNTNSFTFSATGVTLTEVVAYNILSGKLELVSEDGKTFIKYGNVKIPLTQTNVERLSKAIETNSGFIVNENGELLIVVDKDSAGPGEITRRDATKLQLTMLFGAQPTEDNGLYTLTKNGLTITYDPSSNLLNYRVGDISVSPEVASLVLAGVLQVVDKGSSKYIVYGNMKIPLTQTNVERLTRAIKENRGFVVRDGSVYVVVSGKAGEGEISEEELKTVQVPTGVRLVDKDRLTIDDLARGPVRVLIQTNDGRWVPGVAKFDGDNISFEPLAYNAYLTLYRDTINKLGNVTSIRFVDERGNVVAKPSEQDLMWGNLKLQVNVGDKWYDVVVREDGVFVVKDVEVKIPTIKNGNVAWETIRGDMTLDALNQILEYLNTATSREKLLELAKQKIQLPTQNIFGNIIGQSFIDLARDALAKQIVENQNNLFNLVPQLVIQRVGDVIVAAQPVEVQTKSTIVNLPTLDAHGNVVVYKQLDKYDQGTTSVNVVTRSYIENGKPVIELSLRSIHDPNRVYTIVKREVSPGASQEDINKIIQDMYKEALLNYYKDRANFVYDQNRKEIRLETPNLNAIEKTIDLMVRGDTKNINIATVNVPTLEELRMRQQLEEMHPVLRNIFAAAYAAGATLNKP